MKKKFEVLITVSFVVYIFVLSFLFVIIKDKSFSEIENRPLSKMPELNIETLFNKEFEEGFESYVSDQFPLRNSFISLKSYSEYMLLKKENNGVYIADDDYFIEKFESPDKELMGKIAKYINNFSKNYNVYCLVSPTSITINKDKLPYYVNGDLEEETLNEFYSLLDDNIVPIDIIDGLKSNSSEYLFYKTDHHWTTLGAFYAYQEFCKTLSLEPTTIKDYNIEKASSSFYGTLFSKGNFKFAKPDDINLFTFKDGIDIEVDYVYDNKKSETLYEKEYLDKKDKYGVFLDNNHPLVKIKTSANTGKRIAIIKDSYAHSFVPFLVSHYEEIHMIDLRLFKGSINNYLQENNLEDVVLIYNIKNIIKDTNIMRLSF